MTSPAGQFFGPGDEKCFLFLIFSFKLLVVVNYRNVSFSKWVMKCKLQKLQILEIYPGQSVKCSTKPYYLLV